jgi:hypothetical protein
LSNIEVLNAFATNGSGYVFKGIDFTGSYLWNISDANSLSFRLLATKMIDQRFQAQPGGAFLNVVGQTGTGNNFLADNQPAPDWQANLSATFLRGPLSITGQVRYIASGIMDYNGVVGRAPTPGTTQRGLSVNHVPSYQVFSLGSSYTFADVGPIKTLQLFGVIDNLFDRDPPIAPGGGAFGPANANGGTNAIFFDTAGRAYRIGLRTTF